MAVTLLGLIAVTFFIGRVVPIDPVLAIVGDRAPPHVYDRVYRELGLDLPLYEQFYVYAKKVLTGNFGNSVLTTNPVMQDIANVFPATLELATLGTLIGPLIGIPLGVLAAVRRGSLSATTTTTRSGSRPAGRTAASGRCSAAARSTVRVGRTAAG